jgi:type IV secretion system protein VirB4
VVAIDEFWKALADPAFRDVVNDKLKTIRKRNGVLILATQSPRDALNSPIAHSIIEQCPTQILMPNPRADERDYRAGLKLTEPEFRMVREDLTMGGRRFLLKQGTAISLCQARRTASRCCLGASAPSGSWSS